jgi:hypothetical protein
MTCFGTAIKVSLCYRLMTGLSNWPCPRICCSKVGQRSSRLSLLTRIVGGGIGRKLLHRRHMKGARQVRYPPFEQPTEGSYFYGAQNRFILYSVGHGWTPHRKNDIPQCAACAVSTHLTFSVVIQLPRLPETWVCRHVTPRLKGVP